MKTVILIGLSMLLFSACNNKAAFPADAQSTPKKVAEAIFAAAKSGNTDSLATLIDVDADKDSQRIGQSATDSDVKKTFIEYFSKGKVSAEPVIDGDRASVPILFGPDGTKEETFQMVQRDGKWYLSSF